MFQPLPAHIFAGHRDEGARGAPQIKKERVQATASEPQKKRKGFSVELTAKKQTTAIPNVSALPLGKPIATPPPAVVAKKLGQAEIVMGIDIETAGWEDKTKWVKGSIDHFGHYNLCDAQDLDSRVVQVGWAVADVTTNGQNIVKERLIQPTGFVITAKAEKFHGISQERAVAEGFPLAQVLTEFMQDVRDIRRRGGRIVCHHLGFDGGILDKELSRCGMEESRRDWGEAVRTGCCTMSPDIGRWLRTCFGQDSGPPTAKNTMKLRDLVVWFLPGSADLLANHHTAGADAEMHVRLYVEICNLARASGEVSGLDSRERASS